MSRPNVTVTIENNRLGRISPAEDGHSGLIASGVAVAGKFALNDVLGPFKSIEDANDVGLDEDYDDTNGVMVYKHIADFYKIAPRGTELYVMVVAPSLLMADMVSETADYAKKVINFAQGKIRLFGITRCGDATAFEDGFESDLFSAITNAQELAEKEFERYRPLSFILEGRNYQGNHVQARDLRDKDTTPNATNVSVVISQDPEWASLKAEYAKYAQVGLLLGQAAGIPVQRNVGRVRNGKLPLLKTALSNGTIIESVSATALDTLNDKGYIFVLHHAGKDGLFFNDDHTASVITNDFAYLSRRRVIDKAARIIRSTFIEELLNDVEVNTTTGKLAAGTCKGLQAAVEQDVNNQMAGEIAGVSAFVDENQNVLATDTIDITVDIIPKGIARQIRVLLGFKNPFKNVA
jgi:hypothetical protein